ncbi:MAG: DNA gyrase C-terminal beta-propeller domain-containing protein, partial [Pseudomonadota bacterium]
VRGRGGQGVHAWSSKSKDTLIASFPVQLEDQIMLATSGGQSIRVPVKGISFRSRSAGGVRVFNTAKGEKVVSVAWIAEAPDEETEEGETETQTADDEA